MTEKYKKDFDKGYEWSLKYFDPNTGVTHLPEQFSGAFSEGLISGRSKLLTDTFGKYKQISWENGMVNIVR